MYMYMYMYVYIYIYFLLVYVWPSDWSLGRSNLSISIQRLRFSSLNRTPLSIPKRPDVNCETTPATQLHTSGFSCFQKIACCYSSLSKLLSAIGHNTLFRRGTPFGPLLWTWGGFCDCAMSAGYEDSTRKSATCSCCRSCSAACGGTTELLQGQEVW